MIKLGKYTAIISLVLGTIILIHFAITLDKDDIEIGIYYISIAFCLNATILISLFLMAIWHQNYKAILNAITWILINIPIALIYFFIAIYFDSLSEMKFTNKQNDVIKNVTLKWDNESEHWDEIDVDETFFERFKIQTAKPISIEYMYKNRKITESLLYPYPSFPVQYKYDLK